MKEVKKVRLFIEVKKVKYEDKSFNAYKTPIGKLNLDVKFQKDCNNIPEISGYYEFNTDEINLNTTKDYPVLWVKA